MKKNNGILLLKCQNRFGILAIKKCIYLIVKNLGGISDDRLV